MTLPMMKKREGARLPRRQTKGASGYDLHACVAGREAHELIHRCPCHGRDPFCKQCLGHGVATDGKFLVIFPGELRAIPLGLAMQIPEGMEMQIRGRSHYNKLKAFVPIATIDSDYRGEVWVQMINLSENAVVIKHQDRIAQGIFAESLTVSPEWSDELTDTARGERGFGSTGR